MLLIVNGYLFILKIIIKHMLYSKTNVVLLTLLHSYTISVLSKVLNFISQLIMNDLKSWMKSDCIYNLWILEKWFEHTNILVHI